MPSPARTAASAYATSTTSRFKSKWRKRTKPVSTRKLTVSQVRSIARAEARKDREVKHYFAYHQDAAVTNGSLWHQLTAMNNGTTDTNIIGDSADLEKIVIDYTVRAQSAPANAAIGLVIRLFVFQWLDDNATSTPSTTQLFEDSTQQFISPWRFDNVKGKKFKILADKRITLPCYNLDSAGSVSTGRITIDKFAKRELQNIVGSPSGSGHVYMGYVCDTFANGPMLEYFYQTFYTDA